ncbi:MAG: serine hydrolase, partial [Vicinamibacteria bacterium]|nr:serine hydrolase [Vicinamibacteria bacterium]
ADVAARVDAYMQAQARISHFSGVVMVARDGTPVISKGYGWANAEWEVPNTPQTKFRLGSITKQFTATLVLRLQEQKRLAVQDPICTYVAPCPDTWKPVTIHHLLTHTSGIPSYTGLPDYKKTMMVPKTIEQMVAVFRDLSLEFVPGEKFKYNNSGYFLLGVIIEKVAGRKYEEVLRDELFTPLGMKDTGYDWSEPLLPRRAAGYTRRGDTWVNAEYLDMQQPYSAGSLYSTVEDLLIWDQALYTDRVLPEAARTAMFTPFKDNYAYGWAIQPADKATSGHVQIGHGGGINGFSTMIQRVPSDRVAVVVLSNVENLSAGNIARDVMAITYGRPYQMPIERTATPVKPETLAQYVGRYQIAPDFILTVTLEGDRLMTQATGQDKLEVFAESETKFFLKVVDAQLTFGKDADGMVTHVTLHQGGQDRKASKVP